MTLIPTAAGEVNQNVRDGSERAQGVRCPTRGRCNSLTFMQIPFSLAVTSAQRETFIASSENVRSLPFIMRLKLKPGFLKQNVDC